MACKCLKREKRKNDGKPDQCTCGICGRPWCDYCDGTQGPLCHWCHGRGYSTAPLTQDGKPKRVRTPKSILEERRKWLASIPDRKEV